MSGVDEPLDSDSSLFGFIDEFIEENVDTPSQNVTQFFNSIDNHFEPSFDTLPSEVQQQALDRLDILNYVENRLIGGWTERNLLPLLNSYKSKTGKWVPTWRILVEWKSAYFESGRDIFSLAPKHKQKGNRNKKKDSQQLVSEAITKKYLTKERLAVAEAFEYYKSRVIEENRRNTVTKIPRWNSIPVFSVLRDRSALGSPVNEFCPKIIQPTSVKLLEQDKAYFSK